MISSGHSYVGRWRSRVLRLTFNAAIIEEMAGRTQSRGASCKSLSESQTVCNYHALYKTFLESETNNETIHCLDVCLLRVPFVRRWCDVIVFIRLAEEEELPFSELDPIMSLNRLGFLRAASEGKKLFFVLLQHHRQ